MTTSTILKDLLIVLPNTIHFIVSIAKWYSMRLQWATIIAGSGVRTTVGTAGWPDHNFLEFLHNYYLVPQSM